MSNDLQNTLDVSLTRFTNGDVAFNAGFPEEPETVEVSDAVTVRTAAKPGRASAFEVTFSISATLSAQGVDLPAHLSIEVPIPSDSADISYRQVENAAAESLPQVLRDLASLIEQDIARAAAAAKEREQD